ncbi:MAG: ribosome silencing factor [Nitrospiraceae bacterium]|nr:ribosome silencing factor [Nitrospiraceae bacterium]
MEGREIAIRAAEAALAKKAADLIVLELTGLTIVADYFVICSGESTTQVRAIAEYIEEELAKSGVKPLGIEGRTYSHWVLVDYGDVIVHVFEKETRAYYDLEKLWMDAKIIDVDKDTPDMGREDKRAVHP